VQPRELSRGLGPELVGEPRPGLTERRQRVGLPSGPV
jgi:hypothetical protein